MSYPFKSYRQQERDTNRCIYRSEHIHEMYMLDVKQMLHLLRSYSVHCLFWAAEGRRAPGLSLQENVNFNLEWFEADTSFLTRIMLLYY